MDSTPPHTPTPPPTSAAPAARPIAGIHHITAVASDPRRNLDFYTTLLGLRLVKKTVNFDDPSSYHFYFGDDAGRPGTIITFFPWPLAKRGLVGAGFVTATAFSVPEGSLDAWRRRLALAGGGGEVGPIGTRSGRRVLGVTDHDGTRLELIEDAAAADRPFWAGGGVPGSEAIRGFHGATLTVRDGEHVQHLVESVFGFRRIGSEGERAQFEATGGTPSDPGRVIDVVTAPRAEFGKLGAGIVHHIAVRALDDAHQALIAARLAAQGFHATDVRDRSYFRSVYLRERGGVLFEVATDTPGFATDESPEQLGTSLRLPPRYEAHRREIEASLPLIGDAPAVRLRGGGS